MPFKRISRGRNRGKYKSPSGRVWTRRQVSAYYATKGFSRKPKKGR